MEYFLSHIIYILIAGIIIGGLAAIWAYGASHNAGKRDPEMQARQDKACESCALASMCTRFGTEGVINEDEPCEKETANLRLIK